MSKNAMWTVRLSTAAERDFDRIVRWTLEQFGQRQASIYAGTLSLALQSLTGGPDLAGVRSRDDIDQGLSTLHVARRGRAGRHFVLFRSLPSPARTIVVLRLLHDSMDLPRHVPPTPDAA